MNPDAMFVLQTLVSFMVLLVCYAFYFLFFVCVSMYHIFIESSYTYIFYYSILYVVKCIVMYDSTKILCVCVCVCVHTASLLVADMVTHHLLVLWCI